MAEDVETPAAPDEGYAPSAGPDSRAGSGDTTVPAEMHEAFPGYDIREKIAEGGMGTIFLARDLRLDRDVAIKVLTPDLEHNEDAVAQFFSEARTVARLRHANIIRGLDVGRTGTSFYFVMEHVPGETVLQKIERLERGYLPERETVTIVRQVTQALQYIHENGLVHRDVKPGNLLLTQDGVAKLCDLGVAREVAYPTPEAVVKGSPAYASPEQIRGDADVDIRADLYGLGCTWFHMLIGRPPYAADTADEVMHQQLSAPLPDAHAVAGRVSRETSELIQWLMQKDREQRPPTPAVFLGRLDAHPLAQASAVDE